MKKIVLPITILLVLSLLLSGCSDADVASSNLSREADKFNILRRIIFYNGITDTYILTIEGYCAIGNSSVDAEYIDELWTTCKTGPTTYKKHFLGLSDNVTYFAEQLDDANVSVYHYNVIFKPSVILPDIDVQLP